MEADLLRLPAQWAGKRVLVVGDVTLDEYVYGRPTSISREAPVVVLEYSSREYLPGGACSPACTIQSLGGVAQMLGVVGEDPSAVALRECLQHYAVLTDALVIDPTRPTTTKTRICAQRSSSRLSVQQVARINVLDRSPLSPVVEDQVLARLEEQLPLADAVLVSNYMLGMISQRVVDAIRWLGQKQGKLLTVDSQGDLSRFTGYDLVKCNQPDAEAALRRPLVDEEDYRLGLRQLASDLQARRVMITRGEDGSSALERDEAGDWQYHHFPVPTRSEVLDVTGAGDSVIAVLTLALAGGATFAQAGALANYGAGVVVRRWGNIPLTLTALTAALNEEAS